MGNRPRLYEPNLLYSAVTNTVDRQFLLKPNHDRRNPLLAAGCPPQALDPRTDIVPVSSVINIVGAAVGRALEQYPVDLRWFEANVNHTHSGLTARPEQLGNISAFYKSTNSTIARELNRTWQRTGHLFAARPRIEPCLDDRAAKQQLIYAMTNPLKDGLVETVRETPFFSTFRHQASGDPLRFWYLDRAAWWKAGGPRKKSHRLKDFLRWVEYELPPPLPEWDGVPEHKRRAELRALVREAEEEQRETRRREGRRVVGVPNLFKLNPFDKPAEPRESSPQPLCHTSNPQLYFEYRCKWREFLNEYRKASHDYRAGNFDREFPEGSFRPPLVTVYNSSRL
jgi:hypothetical protein